MATPYIIMVKTSGYVYFHQLWLSAKPHISFNAPPHREARVFLWSRINDLILKTWARYDWGSNPASNSWELSSAPPIYPNIHIAATSVTAAGCLEEDLPCDWFKKQRPSERGQNYYPGSATKLIVSFFAQNVALKPQVLQLVIFLNSVVK